MSICKAMFYKKKIPILDFEFIAIHNILIQMYEIIDWGIKVLDAYQHMSFTIDFKWREKHSEVENHKMKCQMLSAYWNWSLYTADEFCQIFLNFYVRQLFQIFYSVKSVLMNFAEQQHRRLLLEIPKMDWCTGHIVYRYIQKEMYQKTRTVFAAFRLNGNGTAELLRLQFRYYHIPLLLKNPLI